MTWFRSDAGNTSAGLLVSGTKVTAVSAHLAPSRATIVMNEMSTGGSVSGGFPVVLSTDGGYIPYGSPMLLADAGLGVVVVKSGVGGLTGDTFYSGTTSKLLIVGAGEAATFSTQYQPVMNILPVPPILAPGDTQVVFRREGSSSNYGYPTLISTDGQDQTTLFNSNAECAPISYDGDGGVTSIGRTSNEYLTTSSTPYGCNPGPLSSTTRFHATRYDLSPAPTRTDSSELNPAITGAPSVAAAGTAAGDFAWILGTTDGGDTTFYRINPMNLAPGPAFLALQSPRKLRSTAINIKGLHLLSDSAGAISTVQVQRFGLGTLSSDDGGLTLVANYSSEGSRLSATAIALDGYHIVFLGSCAPADAGPTRLCPNPATGSIFAVGIVGQ